MAILFFVIGLGAVALAHVAPFPFVLDAISPAAVVWRMPAGAPPTIYLTFDDGPNPEATPGLLDVLARERVQATFFLIDRHLTEETAPIVRRMFREGHAVALHSHTRRLALLPPDRLAETLAVAARRIERLGGSAPCPAFRPHAGWRSGQMLAGLAKSGYRLVGWGWMLWDFNWYRRPSPAKIVKRLLDHASAGDIIVLHDGHHVNPRADRRHTIATTAALVPALRARGFSFATVCENASAPTPAASSSRSARGDPTHTR